MPRTTAKGGGYTLSGGPWPRLQGEPRISGARVVRRWHANNGRAIATITKAVENGDAVWPYPQVAGPAPQGDFVTPEDRPRCRPLVVTKSPLSFSATPRRSPVQQKVWMRALPRLRLVLFG